MNKGHVVCNGSCFGLGDRLTDHVRWVGSLYASIAPHPPFGHVLPGGASGILVGHDNDLAVASRHHALKAELSLH